MRIPDRMLARFGALARTWWAEKISPLKNFGDAVRVPVVALQHVLSASCCFSSLLSFWLPWIYSPFPFFMECLQRSSVATD
jgi:hypothetical protein